MCLRKVLIADDEKEARELLLHFLQDAAVDIEQCADGKSTLEKLESFEPDVLFLDIKMPELNGMEVLQRKVMGSLPAVVFTTAYDEYALPAFDFEAVDYLLKPFEKERFDRALKRARDYVAFVKKQQPGTYITQLPVKTGSRTELVNVENILYFQAEGAYVQVVTGNKTYLVTDPVYELESALDPQRFARVHRSVIVQAGAVKSIRSLLNGDHVLVLSNGKELRASRTYRDAINILKGKR